MFLIKKNKIEFLQKLDSRPKQKKVNGQYRTTTKNQYSYLVSYNIA
jgi:hypothetical protein